MKIAVIGTGYVGLTTGTCLSEIGHSVVCCDIDAKKIALLKSGAIPIYEPGLEELVRRNTQAGRLHFSTHVESALRDADAVFTAVGTPPAADHRADISAVLAVAKLFGAFCEKTCLFINKSTVPVGTADRCHEIVTRALAERNASIQFSVISNPEFLREGTAVQDTLKPDRIVVGADSSEAFAAMRNIYQPIIEKGSVFFETDIRSAELIKYASNALLATKISFMNELSRLCDAVGADIISVEGGVGLDARIGRRFLHAGIGYGGSCFPKDVDALIATAHDAAINLTIAAAVQSVNDEQKLLLLAKMRQLLAPLKGKTIALWGLSFKPKTDDMREAPSIPIIDGLIADGARVVAYDPVARDNAQKIFPTIMFAETALAAVEGADALALLTEWDEFRSVDFGDIKKRMNGSQIFDGRNIWNPSIIASHGLQYTGIGRNIASTAHPVKK